LAPQWYADYYEWMNQGGVAKVNAFLHQRDLSYFSSRGNAPDTEAKDKMRKAAMSSVEGSLEAALEDRDGPFSSDLFTIPDVDIYLRSKGFRSQGPHKVAAMVKAIGCVSLGRAKVEGRGPIGIWACKRVGMYAQLEQTKGIGPVRDRLVADRAGAMLEDFKGSDVDEMLK